jgi:hypothetical protein
MTPDEEVAEEEAEFWRDYRESNPQYDDRLD